MGQTFAGILQIGFTVAGAAIGSFIPGVGTAIGAGIGSLVGGLVGLAFGGGGDAGGLPRPDDVQQTVSAPLTPRLRGYGTARLGGPNLFLDSKEGTAYRLTAAHHGQIDAIVGRYLDDEAVTVDGSGVVTDPSHWAGKVTMTASLGDDPGTAEPALVAAFPSLWTSAHRGDGIVKLLTECRGVSAEDFRDVYPSGTLPRPNLVAKLSRVWDPRDGAQDPDDAETWTWSDNTALCVLDYLTHEDGFRRDRAREILPAIEAWIAAADICDEAVPLKGGGTEPRYRLSGVYALTNRPADVLRDMLATMDGWLYRRADGAISVLAGRYAAPSLTVPARHIVDYSLALNLPRDEQVNTIVASYTSPEHDWTTQEAEAWIDEEARSQAGEELSRQLDYGLVISHGQCRRLMKRAASRAAERIRGQIVTDAYGILARGQRYLRLEISELPAVAGLPDWSDLIVEVTAYRLSLAERSATIEWVLADQAIDAWDPDAEEGTAPAVPDRSAKDDQVLPVPADLAASAEVVSIADGGVGVRILASWTPATRGDLTYEVRYRNQGGGGWTKERPDQDDEHRSALVDAGALYDLQVRTRHGSASSAWSAAVTVDTTYSVSAPAAPEILSVTGGASVTLQWRNADSPNVAAARIWRAPGSPADFEDAFGLALRYSGPNQVLTVEDTPAPGTWTYWVTNETAGGVAGAESDSGAATVSGGGP